MVKKTLMRWPLWIMLVPWLMQCGRPDLNPLALERPVSQHRPTFYTTCTSPGMVALSFDDGVGDSYGPLLDTLQQQQVKATLFVLGKTLIGQAKNSELLRRAAAAGHQIASHSFDHPYLTQLSDQQIEKQFMDTDNALHAILGIRPRLMRPPHGAVNDAVLAKLFSMGFDVVTWSLDTSDWQEGTTSDQVYDRFAHALGDADPAKSSFIALQHDWQSTSVRALPRIVALIRQKGFKLVTVGECLGLP